MDNKGQSVLSEHVMVFFVVVAAIVAMTIFIQRSFEARILDARNFMIESVAKSGACDANCLSATGGQVDYAYEPYYEQMFSGALKNEADFKGTTSGNPSVLGVRYYDVVNEDTRRTTYSGQLPPGCAGANPPSYCKNL